VARLTQALGDKTVATGNTFPMNRDNQNFDGIILMGPFGSGKSHLGRRLQSENVAQYTELEPIVYDLFSNESGFDIDNATEYIRAHYFDTLSSNQGLVAFESTGVIQRPLLLEVLGKYQIALIRICTPKEICLERVVQRNLKSRHPIELSKAAELRQPTILRLK
jgi:hypothetical protein